MKFIFNMGQHNLQKCTLVRVLVCNLNQKNSPQRQFTLSIFYSLTTLLFSSMRTNLTATSAN